MKEKDDILDAMIEATRADVPEDEAWVSARSRLHDTLSKKEQNMFTSLFAFTGLKSGLVSLGAAAAITVTWLAGLNPASSTLAFSSVLENIHNISSYSAIIHSGDDDEGEGFVRVYAQDEKIRVETGGEIVVMVDGEQDRVVTMMPSAKMAILVESDEVGSVSAANVGDLDQYLWLDELKSIEGEADEILPVQEVNGVMAVGYRFTRDENTFTLWADVQTELPVRLEVGPGDIQTVAVDFYFDELDPALFDFEIPEDFQIMDVSKFGEMFSDEN